MKESYPLTHDYISDLQKCLRDKVEQRVTMDVVH